MKLRLLEKIRLLPWLTRQMFFVLSLVIIVLFCGFAIWGDDGLLRLWQLKELKNQIVSENKNILMENFSYMQQVESLKNPSFIERWAKSALGMIRQDEIILVFPEKPKVDLMKMKSDDKNSLKTSQDPN